MQRLIFLFLIGLVTTGNSQVICAGANYTFIASNPQNLSQATFSIKPSGTQNQSGTFVVSPTVTTSYTIYTSGYTSSAQFTTTHSTSELTVNAQPQVNPQALH